MIGDLFRDLTGYDGSARWGDGFLTGALATVLGLLLALVALAILRVIAL